MFSICHIPMCHETSRQRIPSTHTHIYIQSHTYLSHSHSVLERRRSVWMARLTFALESIRQLLSGFEFHFAIYLSILSQSSSSFCFSSCSFSWPQLLANERSYSERISTGCPESGQNDDDNNNHSRVVNPSLRIKHLLISYPL